MSSPFGTGQSFTSLARSLQRQQIQSPWLHKRDKGDQFKWEDDEGLYVSGPIGDRILQQLLSETIPDTVEVEVVQQPPVLPLGLERRQRCEVRTIGSTHLACDCKRYDPQLELPYSLFNKLELIRDFHKAARKLVEEMELPEFWPDITRNDFQVELDDHTVSGNRTKQEMGGTALRWASEQAELEKRSTAFRQPSECRTRGHHFMRYRLRPEKRNIVALRAGWRREGALAVLDGIDYEANAFLLPELLRWCEEYRATKIALTANLVVREEKIKQAVAAKAGQTTANVEAGVDKAVDNDIDDIPLPRLQCRCGHALIWHAKPPPSVTRKKPPAECPPECLQFPAGQALSDLRRSVASRRSASSSAQAPRLSTAPSQPVVRALDFDDTWRDDEARRHRSMSSTSGPSMAFSGSAPQLQRGNSHRSSGADKGQLALSALAALDGGGQVALSELAAPSQVEARERPCSPLTAQLGEEVPADAEEAPAEGSEAGESDAAPATPVRPPPPAKRLERAADEDNIAIHTGRLVMKPRARDSGLARVNFSPHEKRKTKPAVGGMYPHQSIAAVKERTQLRGSFT